MGKGRRFHLVPHIFAFAVAAHNIGCVEDGASPDDAEPLGLVTDVGCAIVTCPAEEACCTEITPDASDSEAAAYARRADLIDSFEQTSDRVRAEFSFEAPDQRGGIVINLGRNVSLYQIDIAATVQAPGALSVQVGVANAATRGCIFSYDLAAAGGASMQVEEVALTDNQFCYNGGVPGFGSIIDVGVYSAAAGVGVIEISNIALLAPQAAGGG